MISNRNSMMHPYRRILHPTDLTARDAFPFQVARALARGLNAELFVMHAAPLRTLIQVPEYRAMVEYKFNLMRLSDPDLKMTTNLFSGDPASEIVGWANDILCDAIVMRCGQNWLVGRVFDNVAQRVKKLVRCPIIAIPEPTRLTQMNEQWEGEICRVVEPADRSALMLS